LLDLCINAAQARATVGEMISAMEIVFKRFVAKDSILANVYRTEFEVENVNHSLKDVINLMRRVREFEINDGRRPRILVAKLGQDGHDRGAKIIATSFSDLGFDVDIGPLFATPDEVANQAVDSDCHAVGISTLGSNYKILIPQLIEKLKSKNRSDIIVIVGGVISPQDYEDLYKSGVRCIFGPGTGIPLAARKVMDEIEENLKQNDF
jgi:methylmalonyl-CoA mutase